MEIISLFTEILVRMPLVLTSLLFVFVSIFVFTKVDNGIDILKTSGIGAIFSGIRKGGWLIAASVAWVVVELVNFVNRVFVMEWVIQSWSSNANSVADLLNTTDDLANAFRLVNFVLACLQSIPVIFLCLAFYPRRG